MLQRTNTHTSDRSRRVAAGIGPTIAAARALPDSPPNPVFFCSSRTASWQSAGKLQASKRAHLCMSGTPLASGAKSSLGCELCPPARELHASDVKASDLEAGIPAWPGEPPCTPYAHSRAHAQQSTAERTVLHAGAATTAPAARALINDAHLRGRPERKAKHPAPAPASTHRRSWWVWLASMRGSCRPPNPAGCPCVWLFPALHKFSLSKRRPWTLISELGSGEERVRASPMVGQAQLLRWCVCRVWVNRVSGGGGRGCCDVGV
jgi:hypothetical protein